jgi:hypothetical protein
MAAAQGQRPQPGAITVPAKPEWTDTGIDLLPGDSCTVFRATGRWSNSLAGPFTDYRGFPNDRTPGLKLPNRLGALIGQVGTGPVVYAGVDATIKATVRGHLLLGMNDNKYDDNREVLYVSLRCDKAPVPIPPATPTAKPTKPTPTPDTRETFEPPNIKTPMPSGRGERKPVPIPNFKGSSPAKAQSWFARYRLKPAIVERPSDQFARGLIFDQQPAPGTDVYIVKEARLFVSTGPPPPAKPTKPTPAPVPIPDFTGWSRVSAEQWLASYGLKAAIDDGSSDRFARGLIFDQRPAPGTDARGVADVRLSISTGPAAPPPTPVPPPVTTPVPTAAPPATPPPTPAPAATPTFDPPAPTTLVPTPVPGTTVVLEPPPAPAPAPAPARAPAPALAAVPLLLGYGDETARVLISNAGFAAPSVSHRLAWSWPGVVLEQTPAPGPAPLTTTIVVTESQSMAAVALGGSLLLVGGLAARVAQKRMKLHHALENAIVTARFGSIEVSAVPDGFPLQAPVVQLTITINPGASAMDGELAVLRTEVRHE